MAIITSVNPIHQNDYGFTLAGAIAIPEVHKGHRQAF
jgi:hypothetical protein